MTKKATTTEKRTRRHNKIRVKVSGTSNRPRLSVFRSNAFVYAQLIDDVSEKTLFSLSTKGISGKNGTEKSKELGKKLAEKAVAGKIDSIVFDRGGYKYTGKIKAVADGAREGGLKF